MTQKINENGKDDTGYYTPKNILNPAMFRLAEITRALSEVNMEIEHEKLFADRRHTINIDQLTYEDEDSVQKIEVIEEGINVTEDCNSIERVGFFKRNEDRIGKALVTSLGVSIFLLVLLLIFWS